MQCHFTLVQDNFITDGFAGKSADVREFKNAQVSIENSAEDQLVFFVSFK